MYMLTALLASMGVRQYLTNRLVKVQKMRYTTQTFSFHNCAEAGWRRTGRRIAPEAFRGEHPAVLD